MISEAKLASNRRNARLSTGPKTPAGKARSSQNALKHGLLPGEQKEELETLENQFLEELRPKGALETLLAGRIVNAAWRLRRFAPLEAEILARQHQQLQEREQAQDRTLGFAFQHQTNSSEALARLYRYEGSLERGLYRGMKELARLQAGCKPPGAQHKRRNEPKPRNQAYWVLPS